MSDRVAREIAAVRREFVHGEVGVRDPDNPAVPVCLEDALNAAGASRETWNALRREAGGRLAIWHDRNRRSAVLALLDRVEHKPRQEVMPQPVAKPVKEKKPTKVRQQRAAARPIPVAAVASVLVIIFVAANIDAIVAAVLYALVFAALTLAALAAGYANGRWVVPYLVRFVDEMLAERRDRAALRAVLSAPIPIEPVPEHDVQEWINRGLRNRRIDGYVAEPVERSR